MRSEKIRNAIFGIIVFQFLLTILLYTSINSILLLPVNIVEHILGIIYFGLLAYIIFLLFIKKEYKNIKKNVLNMIIWIIFLILVVFITQDYFYTLISPHPMFHDTYYI